MFHMVRKKQVLYAAMQYTGPITADMVEFYTGAKKVLNTVTLAGVWKLQIEIDSVTGEVGKASVNDWIIKDSNNAFIIVGETQFANKYEIVS